jgi:hypothetical protein
MLGRLLIGLLGGCVPSREGLRGQSVEQNAEQDGKADRRDHLVDRPGYAVEVFQRYQGEDDRR